MSSQGQSAALSSTAHSPLPTPHCCYVLLGLGKLGGREISYHSDLDVLLVYEAEGCTAGGPEPTANSHYFTELAQRVIRTTSRMGPMGRLYQMDMRLRPKGKSGPLALPLCEFRKYYAGGGAQLWERQMLGRARVVRGEPAFAAEVMAAVREAMLGAPWSAAVADEVRGMRAKLEQAAKPRDLKRGPGGLADVEFLVQLLQLKHGRDHPDVLRPNVWDALDALAAAGLLGADDAAALRAGYTFLRAVEARLRIVTDRPLTEVPDAPADRAKLARRLGFDSPDAFLAELKRVTADVRRRYAALTARERG